MKTKPTGKIGKSSTSKEEAKKEFSKRPGRAAKKGKKMIIPVEIVASKIGQIEKGLTLKASSKAAVKPSANRHVSDALPDEQAARGYHLLGRPKRPLTPLARAIRNAYKGAKAGQHEKAIIARIKAAAPAPSAQEIARALVESGIPAHRASKVAKSWDSIIRGRKLPSDKPMGLSQFLQERDPEPDATVRIEGKLLEQRAWDVRKAAITEAFHQAAGLRKHQAVLEYFLEISPLPNLRQAEDLMSDLPMRDRLELTELYVSAFNLVERGRPESERKAFARGYIGAMIPMTPAERIRTVREAEAEEIGKAMPEEARIIFDKLHKAKAEGRDLLEAIAGPDPLKLASKTQEEDAEVPPKTAEECPAYVKRAFDSAAPDCIAEDAGQAVFEAWPIWAPGRSIFSAGELIEKAGIPSEWHNEIRGAALDCHKMAEEIAREQEMDRRMASAPKTEAEAPKGMGEISESPEENRDPWQPGETPTKAWEKRADAEKWDEEQREDEYNAAIVWPQRNRLKRVYDQADAEFHGLHDLVAQVVAKEIIALQIVEPGPYPMNWLNDVLKKAEIPAAINLSVGFHLAKMGLGTSREWKVQTLKETADWAPKGLEFHYRASILASFRPLLSLGEADSYLKEAGYAEADRAGILKAFEEVAARVSCKK